MTEEQKIEETQDSIEETPEEQLANDEISPEEEGFEKGFEESAKESLKEETEDEIETKVEENTKDVEKIEEKKEEKKEEKPKAPPVLINEEKPSTAPMIGGSTRLSGAAELPTMKGTREITEEEPEEEVEKKVEEKKEDLKEEIAQDTHIYALRTTANREEQVMDFVSSNAARKKLGVYAVINPHGMRGYIFLEAINRQEAEQAAYGVPYAKGILPSEIQYVEIEHMLEQVKKEVNIQKNDIAEILNGPFKREKCKVTRIDKTKDEVVVELLEAAVPIPITLKMDSVKVIRRETND